MDMLWLPSGDHWGLTIYHRPRPHHTGGMIQGAEPKCVLHTTEGNGLGAMDRVLTDKKAEPHVLIDPGTRQVIQYIPLNQYALSLEHPAGTPETNRAGCIQVEIAGFAAPNADHRDVAEESIQWYTNLAACLELLRHRAKFVRASYHEFKPGARRITSPAFKKAGGIMGHMHVPNQPYGHWDPGAINIKTVISGMRATNGHYS